MTAIDPAKLIEQHQAGVWRYLRALGCEAAQADDITQETFLAVLKKPFIDYGPSAAAGYLRKIAFNLFITSKRLEKKIVATDAIEAIDAEWSRWAGRDNGDALLEALRLCLQTLSQRSQMALEMRFHERVSRTEIASALEITEHGAKNLMQRAKKKLRTCIEGKLK